MRPSFSKLFAGVTVLLLGASVQAFAQREKAHQPTISAADQKAITALFAGVDKSKYRLQFNNGREAVGSKKVSMEDLAQTRKITNPGEAAGYVVLVTEGRDVVYVLAVGKKDLTTVLGAERANKLNTIMSKYAR